MKNIHLILHVNSVITILFIILLSADIQSQSTAECNPPCVVGQMCNDSGECIDISYQQTQKPEPLPEKPRKSIRKPVLAVITGSLMSGSIITGIICYNKRYDPLQKWVDLRDEWKKETNPDEKSELKKQMDQAEDDVDNIKTIKNLSLIFMGSFGIAFTVNLIIPSR